MAAAIVTQSPSPAPRPASPGKTYWEWVYEMRPPLPGELALCPPTGSLQSRLVRALLDPARANELPSLHQEASSDADYECACAANVGGLLAVMDAGRYFAELQPWIDSADRLLDREQDISALGRGALALYGSLARLAGTAKLYQVRESLNRAASLAEEADSDTLRALHAAVSADCEFLSGRLLVAKAVLADALALNPGKGPNPVALIHLNASVALIDIMRGHYDAARERLEAIVGRPKFGQLPAHLWLLCMGHYLLALSYCDRPEAEIDACAERMRSRTVPEQNSYFHNYLHYTLGAAALLAGRPETALFHARTSALLGKRCHSAEAERTPAALEIQALNDLGRHEEALSILADRAHTWREAGANLLVATTAIEEASILLRYGDATSARAALHRARAALPPGEDLPRNLRTDHFVADLIARLEPKPTVLNPAPRDGRPVQIATFGELRVEINGKVIYDRDWHGSRGKTLLKALIVLGGYKVAAERLADLLWPDADGDIARNNLKVSLWRLRRLGCGNGETPLPWIAIQHGHVSLVDSLCRVDCIEFERELSAALECSMPERIRAALASAATDFLAADDSEPWIARRREHLRRRHQQGVAALQSAAAG